jgi:alpha-L-glutamate ligase-like protein
MSLDAKDWLWTSILAVLVMIEISWVRLNIDFFGPVLEGSLLFFEIIIAATLIAFLRNVVGLKTYGVFGPAIIALGLRQTGPTLGLALYLDIFLVVMLTSMVLHRLNISSSHRVAVVITVSAMTITMLELLGESFHISILEASIFFPILITSWLGDRFVMQVRETDWIEPSKRLFGTVLAIILSFGLMSLSGLVRFVALNPESWAVIILINIFIGLKVNFRLMEYIRFRPVIRSLGGSGKVLSLNKRNRDYVARYNQRNLYPHIRKDRMKKTFHQLDIPTPETYCIIETKKEIACAEEVMRSRDSFVIKPSSGFGGEGIMVVDKNANGDLISKGKKHTIADLKRHIAQILDGQFSTDWSDVAIIEQKVVNSDVLDGFYSKGVPDIRVIVFEGFPIMAMSRLPTVESGGAANMHKGAVGMGLSIAEGRGKTGFWRGHGGTTDKHPDTGKELSKLLIPDWKKVLEIASHAQAASRLGYVGVDIVLDRTGPMVLEVNKRPGLEIQNTNLAGLLERIQFVEKRLPEVRFLQIRKKVLLSQKWDSEGWK